MNLYLEDNTSPKPNGESGYIKTYDPQQKSFKNALITILFCGVCLESLLHLINVNMNGVATAKKFDREIYEKKLKILGCDNQEIIKMCTNYRASRKEIVHEKAHLDDGSLKTAQREAELAMHMLHQVIEYFDINIG